MPATNQGLFVPTNYIWDVQQLEKTDVNSPEFKELLIRLYQNLNIMSIAINMKVSGLCPVQEFVNGKLWYPNPNNSSLTVSAPDYRQVYQTVVNFGPLPNTGTTMIAHNIPVTLGYSFTDIYATASDQTNLKYIPIPYVDVIGSGAANIEISVDDTYVYITTASNRSTFNICDVWLEYIKS